MSTVGTVIRMKTRLLQWLDRKADKRIERVTGQPAGKHRAPRDMTPPVYPQMVGRQLRTHAEFNALLERDQAALAVNTKRVLDEILTDPSDVSGTIEQGTYLRALEIPLGSRHVFAFNYLAHALKCNTHEEALAVARGLKRALAVQ